VDGEVQSVRMREAKDEDEVVVARKCEERKKREGIDRTFHVWSIVVEYKGWTEYDEVEEEVAVEGKEREEEAYLPLEFVEGVERKKRRVEEFERVLLLVDVVHVRLVVRIAERDERVLARTMREVERNEVAKGENIEIVGCGEIGFDRLDLTCLSRCLREGEKSSSDKEARRNGKREEA